MSARPKPPSRAILAVAALVVTVAGLTVHVAARGPAAGFIADGLYAALLTLIIALIWPRALPWWAATVAAVMSAGVELFQLTSIPARLGEHIPWITLVLGTTFAPLDLLAYVLGSFAVGAIAFGAQNRSPHRHRLASEVRSR